MTNDTDNIGSVVMAMMAGRAAKAIPVNEGDYVQDGILYCSSCHTPKQTRVQWPDGISRLMYCMCSCMAAKRDAEEKARREREEAERIRQLRQKCFPDAAMMRWTFDQDDQANPKLSEIAQRYVGSFDRMKQDGKGILLYGGVGTGKSFLAACIANALIDKGIPCLMTNFVRLVNTMQGMIEGRQAFLDDLNRYPLLVLDDLAAERDTEFMQEAVTSIIDARYQAKLPLIVTTNLTGEELRNAGDLRRQRIYSRLYELCIPVEVKGVDRRRINLGKQYGEYAELLGLGS